MTKAWGLLLVLLLLPSDAAAQDRDGWPIHLAIAAYMVAGQSDIAQTAFCLGARTCRELNPFLRPLMDRRGVVPALSAKGALHVGVSYVFLRAHKQHPKAAFWAAVASAAIQGYVVHHNAREARSGWEGRP
jgi:hypothetical protein